MTRHLTRSVRLCLVLALIIGLTPKTVRADGGGQDGSIRLFATAAYGPIGRVIWNLPGSTAAINSCLADGEQAIWNGDLIEATGNTSVRVWLDSVGQVTLRCGARARLAITLTGLDHNGTRRVLVASLISGDMGVKLEQDAVAYVECCGSAFTSSSGANFCIRVREGRALADEAKGAVWIQDLDPPTIKPASVQVQPNRIINLPPNTPIAAKPRDIKPISSQWKRHRRIKRVISLASTATLSQVQSQEVVETVAFRKVHFKVDARTGTIDPEGITDANGVVTVNFTAAAKAADGTIIGVVEPDPAQDGPDARYEDFTRDVKIKVGFFSKWGQYVIPPIIGAVLIEEILRRRKGKDGPIVQMPPPMIP